MTQAPGRSHPWPIRAAGIALAVAATVSIVFSMRSNWGAVRALTWSPALAFAMAEHVALTAATTVNTAAVWTLLLPAGALSPRDAYRIVAKTQLLKYAFGNVFHFVGRAHLARLAGITGGRLALSLVLEVATVLAAACLLAVPGLVLLGPAAFGLGQHGVPSGRLILSAVAGLLLVGIGAGWTSAGRRVVATALEHRTGVVIGAATNSVIFIATGVLIHAALEAGWPHGGDVPVWKLTSGFCLAWVLGYLTPGAPGGIGIREGVFLLLLGPELGGGVAVAIAVLFRLSSISGEILGYLSTFVMAPAPRTVPPHLSGAE